MSTTKSGTALHERIAEHFNVSIENAKELEPIVTRFAEFDPSGVYHHCTKRTFDLNRGGKAVFVLPTFCSAKFDSRTQRMLWRGRWGIDGPIPTDAYEHSDRNEREFFRLAGLFGNPVLVAEEPMAPSGVRRRVNKLMPLFSQVVTLWEAEWKLENRRVQGVDPLVLGEKLGLWFVIDRWDLTKLESYIDAEFSSRPKFKPEETEK